MEAQVRLRAAALPDVDAITTVQGQAPDTAAWTQADYVAFLPADDTLALVAELTETERVVGFLIARTVSDEMEILNLGVLPEFRRRGLGRRLVAEALARAQARGVQSCWLEVRASNRAAQAFYRALGFVERSRRRGYYRKPDSGEAVEDAVVCLRRLAPPVPLTAGQARLDGWGRLCYGAGAENAKMIRTGWYFALPPASVAALLFWVRWWGVGVVCLALAGFVLFFFRNPERQVPALAGAVVSPADGRVLSVDVVQREAGQRTRITVFLSIFDIHVNRAPIGGTIATVRYQPGRFHVASRPRASAENEQNEVTVEGEGTQVVFKQIAGIIARRIEFWKQPGDRVERGERVGMIRFGSRVEVFLEPHYRVQVKPGQHVAGGATVLAVRE